MVRPLPLLVALAACASDPTAPRVPPHAAAGADGGCAPLETRPPNAPDQQPSFPGQTRACASPSGVAFHVAVVATGLEHPWSVEPLPDGRLVVTERPGRMRLISATGTLGPPLAGLPAVDARGQGGLLDVAVSPTFATDRVLWWSYAEPRQGGNGTAVARGVLSVDDARLQDVRVIFRAAPTHDNDKHFGSRVVPGPDGLLYVTLGERFDPSTRVQAQRTDGHLGKVVRVGPEGAVPASNPLVGSPGARPEIWSLGHRNVQAAAFDAQGRLWVVEHGAQGGDELNLVKPGLNYGWPEVAYGEDYGGAPLRGAVTAREGTEPPVYFWDPVIAPSGATFYDGDAFPAWRGSLFIGALRDQRLVRLVLRDGRVVGEEHLLVDRHRRIRDVVQGRDGALYLATDDDAGEIWRLTPVSSGAPAR